MNPSEAQNPDVPAISPAFIPFSMIAKGIRSNPSFDAVGQVFLWKNPVKSGLFFGIGTFFVFLITIGEYTTLTLVSYLLLSLMSVCFVFSTFQTWKTGKNPLVEPSNTIVLEISPTELKSSVGSLTNLIQGFQLLIYNILTASPWELSFTVYIYNIIYVFFLILIKKKKKYLTFET
eukprot:TRINITY_DN4256_c0_g1_i4.p1 TRINITY_DN4256_c0_g1~~TRINITY_DN4256_c0_g1_i4.p1  ORF type:complete len:176 (-),score=19.66 TRINITY_DN4256_c0_g1_i4:259-786(-)